MRRGPPQPSVMKWNPRTLRSLVDSQQGPDRAKRRPATLLSLLLSGNSWSYVGPFFALFAHVGCFLGASYASLVFWDAFFSELLTILDGFREDFGMVFRWIFRSFCQKSQFCKNRCFSIRKLLFSRIRASKNQAKIHQKSMQISYGKIRSKKMLKKWIWDGLGLYLGGGWRALGRLFVPLGRFLAISGSFKNELL